MLAFAKTRRAFGRPVGTFQALAHAMADLQVEIDSARLLAYRAGWLLAQGKPCGREGPMAKLKGSGPTSPPPGWACRSAPGTASPPRA